MGMISTIAQNKDIVSNRFAVKAILITSFIMMTALGAYVRIPLPFTPVPITLQTFFVILCGAVLGKKLGSITQASYVLLGALGMPIFQSYGFGMAHIAGPTGGYLIGFVVAAFVTGTIVNKNNESTSFLRTVFAMSLGLLCIYFFGAMWLSVGYKFELAKAFSLGVFPFIPGAIAKLACATAIYLKVKPRIDNFLK